MFGFSNSKYTTRDDMLCSSLKIQHLYLLFLWLLRIAAKRSHVLFLCSLLKTSAVRHMSGSWASPLRILNVITEFSGLKTTDNLLMFFLSLKIKTESLMFLCLKVHVPGRMLFLFLRLIYTSASILCLKQISII